MAAPDWLAGEGEMRRRIREFDWSQHRLGSPQNWPQSLRTVIRIMLDSRYAMWMAWGEELTFFCNDAYARDTLGTKQAWALGRPAREVWAEIWSDISPRIERVLRTGEATWDEGLLLFLERSGYPEETYHTFSYSPIYNDAGQRGGMLCVVTEETKKVISERRLSLLRELGANTTRARTIDEACARFVQTLEQTPADIPFGLIYLFGGEEGTLSLKGSVQVPVHHAARLPELRLGEAGGKQWPVAEALAAKKPVAIPELPSRFGKFCSGPYPEPAQMAVVLPIPGADAEHPVGALVLGVNPRRALDDDYEGFFQLVAGQFGTAISNAQSYEKERQRAEGLAELDRAKTAFFSNVSHEFRTPLTLMLGPLEELLAQNGAASPADVQREIEVVHRNGLRLLKLVNTLLDFSRLEAGRTQANYVPTDLGAFTVDLASSFRSTMERAGLKFEVHCVRSPLLAFVDHDMWEKIVFNLLSNAFKFTLEGGVSLELKQEANEAVLRVSDTGTGIPAEELPNVFKRFHRVQNVRARTHEGTGIGLALVHELVKLHGGSITVESRVNGGTTFTIRLPLGKDHLSAERISSPSNQASTALRGEVFVEEASRWKAAETGEAMPPATITPEAAPASAERPRVLVADDNADMRDYIARLLQGHYELETVGDGAAALEAARRHPPDLILSDVMMPGMDGLELLHAIREDSALQTVPFIFLSARAGEEARVEGIGQGVDDYLTKPFSSRELVARIEAHLKLSRLREAATRNEKALRAEAEMIGQVLRERSHSLEIINRVGATLAGELDKEKLIQAVTDAGREISGAEFGAFFYNVKDGKGESYLLYTLSGAPREAFARFPMPRNTEIFGPTFRGEGVVRIADVLQDSRYGHNAPYFGMPKGHLPVRSYLAVPVTSRSGEVLGGLFYGHSKPGMFTAEAEKIIAAVAAQAAIALDNAELYRAAQRLAAIVESSDDAILTKNLDGVVTSWNQGAERMFGYTAREIIGKSVTTLLPADRAKEELHILEHVRRGERVEQRETVRQRKDGRLLDVSLTVSPVKDAQGNVVGASSIARDITERVRAKEQLEQTVAARTASLREVIAQMEEFSYTVSHDLRSPVRAMKGYAEAVLDDYGAQLQGEAREFLERIIQSGTRMDRLIQDVLTYSRVARQDIQLHPVDLDRLVRDMLQQYPQFEASRAQITVAQKLPVVLGHEPSLVQVLSNLLNNAVKFVPRGTQPKVVVGAEVISDQARIWVQDNGIGINPEYQHRLFGMFERIHPNAQFEGTGIGLAVVRKAMERMGGKVGVESDGVHGSKFWFQLPKAGA